MSGTFPSSLEGSKAAACQENSSPVSVCGTIFICRLGICDLNQMPFECVFFSPLFQQQEALGGGVS